MNKQLLDKILEIDTDQLPPTDLVGRLVMWIEDNLLGRQFNIFYTKDDGWSGAIGYLKPWGAVRQGDNILSLLANLCEAMVDQNQRIRSRIEQLYSNGLGFDDIADQLEIPKLYLVSLLGGDRCYEGPNRG